MRLVFDFEATGAQRNKAHPFDHRNKACNVGFEDIDTGESYVFKLEYDDEPYGEALERIQKLLDGCSLLVGFNVKFDLHYLRRYDLTYRGRIFDCQLAYYILTYQKNKWPSLDEVAAAYGLPQKLDVVRTEYWDRGLDTDQVPYPILERYLCQDLKVTKDVYRVVSEHISKETPEMKKLISIGMQDIRVLEDIEWNGLLYNNKKSLRLGDELQERLQQIDTRIKELAGVDWFNVGSGDHLSVVLYGGTINIPVQETYIFTYKDGRTKEKTRNTKQPVNLKGMFQPLERTELKKAGFYKTDVATIETLAEKETGERGEILQLLLVRSKLEKQRSTYFHGFPKRIKEMNWNDNVIHSNFNQVRAETGRLSSDKPNVQNLEAGVKECFISRFKIRRKGG